MMLSFHRHVRQTGLILAALAGMSASQVSAAVSYFMLLADFNGDSTMESYKWQVNYTAGQLNTGKDLLDAIFGDPVPGTGDNEGFSYASGYGLTIEYGFAGAFLSGVANAGDNWLYEDIGVGWAYYAAGGSYSYVAQRYEQDEEGIWQPVFDEFGNPIYDTFEGVYPTSDWTRANSGFVDHLLEDGSFNAFVYSPYNESFIPDYNLPATGSPASFFSGEDTIVVNIPEPGKGVLLLLAGAFVCMRRRR